MQKLPQTKRSHDGNSLPVNQWGSAWREHFLFLSWLHPPPHFLPHFCCTITTPHQQEMGSRLPLISFPATSDPTGDCRRSQRETRSSNRTSAQTKWWIKGSAIFCIKVLSSRLISSLEVEPHVYFWIWGVTAWCSVFAAAIAANGDLFDSTLRRYKVSISVFFLNKQPKKEEPPVSQVPKYCHASHVQCSFSVLSSVANKRKSFHFFKKSVYRREKTSVSQSFSVMPNSHLSPHPPGFPYWPHQPFLWL